MSLQAQIKQLFADQTQNWPLAKKNFADLGNVKTRCFCFDGFEVKIQFNPARMVSSGAKIDAKTIAQRPCFLCTANRPTEQDGIAWGDYTILINPFPIFPEHFTIPRNEHVPQRILPYFADMLALAHEMTDYVVFYNGPKCGASAPDHMHFQAGTKSFLPLISDYSKLPHTVLKNDDEYTLSTLPNYLRTVYCIEAETEQAATNCFEQLYTQWQNGTTDEPMMNIVCTYQTDQWHIFLLPRKNFRPWQYTAEPDQQLLVSPATVEMSGMFITPVKEHFEKITKDDIISILHQASLNT